MSGSVGMKACLVGTFLGVSVCAATAAAAGNGASPMLGREDFNRLAAAADVPLYWLNDDVNPGQVDPRELVTLGVGVPVEKWVSNGQFTMDFMSLYMDLTEARRREAVSKELNQARPTLVETDLSGLSGDEKDIVRHVLKAAEMTDRLHRVQKGAGQFEKGIAGMRPEDRALFMRNNGPWCEAPATADDPFCNAVPGLPDQISPTYPADEKQDLDFCKKLASQKNAAKLMDPFTVVRHGKKGGYEAVSLVEAYGDLMNPIANELDAAAAVAKKIGEKPFAAYLAAAAKGFRTNDWGPADMAWAAMNALNSKFFLRIGPDEVYWDLCQQKAGFHTEFALIDKSSLDLQAKLNPLRTKMENAFSAAAPVYKARNVKFQMPDFIEVIMNAGDARKGIGATIGQSLPNWGKVVEQGRGRTVVMTNLYQDPDSKAIARARAAELLTPDSMQYVTEEQLIALIDIILHEATHNLGPYSDYRVKGKRPGELFGGQMATVLEELKAQIGSWYYVPMLVEAGVITQDQARQLYTHALVWSFGHLSQGLFTSNGNPKPYSQLSAVIVGRLVEAGALEWVETVQPDGSSRGLFNLKYDMIPAAIAVLVKDIITVKATGDSEGAKTLVEPWITGAKKSLVHMDEIKARLAGYPKSSMVYRVKM